MTFPIPVLGVSDPRDSSLVESMLMFGWNLLMVGWRFHPTDEELISKHLKPKILGKYKGDDEVIGEIDLCNVEPWDLPNLSKLKSDDQEWYFLCPRNFFMKSRRSKRRTTAGFWKPTGKNLTIKARRSKTKIGTKKTLVFYLKASPKADVVRTGWIIHEYEYTREPNLTIQEEFVLIKLKKKDINMKNKGKGMTQIGDESHHMESDVENQITSGVENPDTYCEGEPSCGMSANIQDQSLNEQTFGSAGAQNQVSQYMVSSDFEYCSLDELIPNSAPTGVQVNYCLASGFDNRNPIMLAAAMSSDDSCLKTSGFENQNYASEFRDESISSLETPPELRNQSGSSGLMGSTSKYQDKEAHIPAPGEDALDFGKQNPYTKSNMPTYDQIDWHSWMARLPQGNVPEGMATSPELNPELQADFTGDGTHLSSYIENQSPLDNSEPCCLRASDLKNQSTQNDGESRSLVPTDFEKKNTDKNTNISVSQDGQRSPLTPSLLDFDLSVFGENCWSPPLASLSGHDLENYVAQQENMSPEEKSQLLEELKAFFELKNCLNSSDDLLPMTTEKETREGRE